MEHSDELTFAEYFKSRYDLFRGLISFVVAMQWLIDHDFAEPTDRDARLMDMDCDAAAGYDRQLFCTQNNITI